MGSTRDQPSMKISFDIDCTPEEARRFFGLPDLATVHELYLEQMKKAIAASLSPASLSPDGLSPDGIEALMRSWSPMGEAGMGLWRQMLDRMNPTSDAT